MLVDLRVGVSFKGLLYRLSRPLRRLKKRRGEYEMSNVPSRTGVKVEPIFAGRYPDNPLYDTYTQRFRAFEKLKYALRSPGQHGIQMSTCAWQFPPVSNVRSVAHIHYLYEIV